MTHTSSSNQRSLRAWTNHLCATALALVAVTHAGSAKAWGAEGHRIIGLIAEQDLSLRARTATNRILKGVTLADESTWMDQVRSTGPGRKMSKWHYVNLDLCSPSPRESCPEGNCAPGRVEWAVKTLRDGVASTGIDDEEKRTALRVLIHLVGDIHQPLHASDNHDAGGNDVVITNRSCSSLSEKPGSTCKLHTYWDSTLVKNLTRGASEQQRALQWANAFSQLPSKDSLDPWVWTKESHAIARQMAYSFAPLSCQRSQSSANLTTDYDRRASVAVQQRITLAGRRLALLLNDIYDR